MVNDLIQELYRELKLKSKVINPREVAKYYLGLDIWKLHDEFYKLIENDDYNRVVIIAPRGHGKSSVFSYVLPLWAYLNNHNTRCLVTAKTADQAKKTLALIKQDFEKNRKIREDFGDLREQPWKEDKIYLKRDSNISLKDPSFEAVGVLGAITGAHFSLIIADDLLDDENTKTEKRRQSVHTWFKKTVEPLLEPHGKIYVAGTRKHYKDLYGNLLDNPIWYHVACRYKEYGDHKRCGYRAINKEPGKWEPLYDDNGVLVDIKVETKDFEILLPERWSIEKLLMNKISMGTPIFQSEFQNDPTGLQGLLLDEDWIQYYENIVDIENITMKTKIMAFDLAVSEKSIESGDYFAGVVLGASHDNKFYLIDTIYEHLDFPSQVRRIQFWYDLHRPDFVIIETNAYQKALAQHLIETTMMPIIEKKQTTDKYTRLLEITPYFEAKRVYLHKDMIDFLTEYKEFPRGSHEDLLDAFQLALSEITTRTMNYEAMGWSKYDRERPHFDTRRGRK